MKEIKIGTIGEAKVTASVSNSAAAVGSGTLYVFATPMMIALIEESASKVLEQFLDEDETTVGTLINVSHISATPLSMEITAKCEVTEVNGKEVTFKVSACDAKGLIGEGIHKRFVVNSVKFMNKANSKML